MKHTLLLPAAVISAIAATAANAQANRPVNPGVGQNPNVGVNPGAGQNPNIGVNPGFGPGSPNFGGNSPLNYGPSFGPGAPNFTTPGYTGNQFFGQGNGFFGQGNGFGSFNQTPFGQTPFVSPGFSGAFFNPYGYLPYGGGVYNLTPNRGTLGFQGTAPVPNIAGQVPNGAGAPRPSTGPVLVAPGATSRVGAGAAGSILPGNPVTSNGAGDVRPGGGAADGGAPDGGAPGGGIPATGADPLTAPVQTAPATAQQQALARQASQQMAQGPMRQGRLVSRNKSTALVTYTVDGQLQSTRVPLNQVYFFQPGGAMATMATNPNTLEVGNRVMIPDAEPRSMVAGSRQESRGSTSSRRTITPRRTPRRPAR